MAIHFFSEDTAFRASKTLFLKRWIKAVAVSENFRLGTLNFIFCSDAYLLDINQQYLQHDTFTDIITFDTSEKSDELSGDIFISIDRVKENAARYAVSEFDELCRIVIHGTLHLLGYKDKTASDKKKMTEMEDLSLARRSEIPGYL